jgi:virulence factor Mce-like protein
MKPFRERNPLPIAVIGLLILALMVVAGFEAANLPIIGGGVTYTADFADVGGLVQGDDVRVAGVRVGSVTGETLDGDQVKVSMKVNHGTALGSLTGASIQLETLLGQEYIALTPAGGGDLTQTIPLARTATPLLVPQAFGKVTTDIGSINTGQLAQALRTIARTFAGSPPYVTSSLQGLSRLSIDIASRDAALSSVLSEANSVTGTLAGRDQQITGVINDGDVVLQLIEQQRNQIHQLFVQGANLALQLSGLVAENRAKLGPALNNLNAVLAILLHEQTNLGNAVHLLGPFVRVFTNTLAQGRWFDTFIANITEGPGHGLQIDGHTVPLPGLASLLPGGFPK